MQDEDLTQIRSRVAEQEQKQTLASERVAGLVSGLVQTLPWMQALVPMLVLLVVVLLLLMIMLLMVLMLSLIHI